MYFFYFCLIAFWCVFPFFNFFFNFYFGFGWFVCFCLVVLFFLFGLVCVCFCFGLFSNNSRSFILLSSGMKTTCRVYFLPFFFSFKRNFFFFSNSCAKAQLFSYLTESYTWPNLHFMLIVPVLLISPGAVLQDKKLWSPLKSLIQKTKLILKWAFTDIYFSTFIFWNKVCHIF